VIEAERGARGWIGDRTAMSGCGQNRYKGGEGKQVPPSSQVCEVTWTRGEMEALASDGPAGPAKETRLPLLVSNRNEGGGHVGGSGGGRQGPKAHSRCGPHGGGGHQVGKGESVGVTRL